MPQIRNHLPPLSPQFPKSLKSWKKGALITPPFPWSWWVMFNSSLFQVSLYCHFVGFSLPESKNFRFFVLYLKQEVESFNQNSLFVLTVGCLTKLKKTSNSEKKVLSNHLSVWNKKIKSGCFFVQLSFFVKSLLFFWQIKTMLPTNWQYFTKRTLFFLNQKKREQKHLHLFACLNNNTFQLRQKTKKWGASLICFFLFQTK